MIPRFGRILPFMTSVLGIIDVRELWSRHISWAIVIGIVTGYLIYLMFRRHHAMSPKKTARYIVITFLCLATIWIATYLVFF